MMVVSPNRLLNRGSAFSPRRLFAAGVAGVWFDPSDLSTMFQDAAGTTPATVDSVVGLMLDKSGNGCHASRVTTANKPILRRDAITGLYYLEFDGVDDELLGTGNWAANASLTLVAGWSTQTTTSDSGILTVAPGSTSNYSQRCLAVADGTTFKADARNRSVSLPVASVSSPTVVYGYFDIVTGIVGSTNLNAEVTGGGSLVNTWLGFALGRGLTGTSKSNAKLYSALIIAKQLTATEKTRLVGWMNRKTGAY